MLLESCLVLLLHLTYGRLLFDYLLLHYVGELQTLVIALHVYTSSRRIVLDCDERLVAAFDSIALYLIELFGC